MLIKECHLEKSCYFKDRANQGLVNQGLTVGILLASSVMLLRYYIIQYIYDFFSGIDFSIIRFLEIWHNSKQQNAAIDVHFDSETTKCLK